MHPGPAAEKLLRHDAASVELHRILSLVFSCFFYAKRNSEPLNFYRHVTLIGTLN